MSEAAVAMTIQEFLSWEQRQECRHELVAGRAYAMSGGSERHGLMAAYLLECVAPGARQAGCRPFGDGRMLKIGRDFYYPDVMVVCGRPGHDLYETDASLVIEVLSPTTRSTDRREKSRRYQELPSIEQYVLVEPDLRRMEVIRWAGDEERWAALGAGDELVSPYGTWGVDDIYDVVDAMSGRDTRT